MNVPLLASGACAVVIGSGVAAERLSSKNDKPAWNVPLIAGGTSFLGLSAVGLIGIGDFMSQIDASKSSEEVQHASRIAGSLMKGSGGIAAITGLVALGSLAGIGVAAMHDN